jgi:hypothetical protein
MIKSFEKVKECYDNLTPGNTMKVYMPEDEYNDNINWFRMRQYKVKNGFYFQNCRLHKLKIPTLFKHNLEVESLFLQLAVNQRNLVI